MKPEVFLKAAKKIEKYKDFRSVDHCCFAIDSSDPSDNLLEERFFLDLFNNGELTDDYLWEDPSLFNKDQEARRLALLFAYEIAKEEIR